MSSPIIFVRVLPLDSTTIVWDTKSTVNTHIFFCEEEDCGNEARSDTLCDSCRRLVICGPEWEAENLKEIQEAVADFMGWEAGEIDDDGNPVE